MRSFLGGAILALTFVAAGVLFAAGEAPPPWAYGFAAPAVGPIAPPPPAAPIRDDGTLKHLPGSSGAFMITQIRDAFGPADWYPGDHPKCPTSSRTDEGPTCAPAVSATTPTARAVPKTRIQNGMFLRLEHGETEPIGQRIIETPEETERTELLRDARSGFIAYVPVGSVKKGEALVTTGAGKTPQCAVCHGADLKGLGPVPGIAGRSPSYTVRQLYDVQRGTRKGERTDLMKPVVAKLSNDDMLAIAAYTASRVP